MIAAKTIHDFIKPFTLLAVMFYACQAFADHGDMWQKLRKSNSVSAKLMAIETIARTAKYKWDNVALTDSILAYGLNLAYHNGTANDVQRAMELYFEYVDLVHNKQKALTLAEKFVLQGTPETSWLAMLHKSKVYQANFDYKSARVQAEQAVLLAKQLADSLKVGISYMQLGSALANTSDKLLALRYLLKARDRIYSFKNLKVQYNLNMSFYAFYRDSELYPEAEQYVENMTQFTESSKADIINYFEKEYWRLYLMVTKKDGLNHLDDLLNLIKLSREKGYRYYENSFFAMYRTALIDNNEFVKLASLYRNMYPERFILVKSENPELYYRMRAYFNELDGYRDSANFYWIIVLDLMKNSKEVGRIASVYIRYAEFLERLNHQQEALEYYKKAYDIAKANLFRAFQVKCISRIEAISLAQGNLTMAYELANKRHALLDTLNEENERDKLLLTEVVHEANQERIRQEATISMQQKRSVALSFGLAIFLILSLIIFYQFKQTNIQKERSDELLLNILPLETANELRENGRTTARRYNQVTVLFADIVGFSKIAERMEPGVLVNVIDSYFRAFDEVCMIYGLEKIKTIGDAYVAVGGLPRGNLATAEDAVNAALSMQHVAKKLNDERGENHLNLRIGLNTGDVVAGVVGSRKFQFDIWGDAVNIAARMEQNCEPGKVNISETTYQLIKTNFSCVSRGNIAAKNKGDLAMYFVEGPKKTKT